METRRVVRGELALLLVIVINSLGVVLMLRSGAGISAISSVAYALSRVLPQVSLGTWTYLFQGALVASLFVLRKRFVAQYLASFIVGFFFGVALDVHELWVSLLPQTPFLCVIYFVISYLLIAVGIALSNRCRMPIIPTDLFPRELTDITGLPYSRIKIPFDVICLAVTALLTFAFLGHVEGLGVGTVLAAFTMGKAIALAGGLIDRYVTFVSFLDHAPHGRAAKTV